MAPGGSMAPGGPIAKVGPITPPPIAPPGGPINPEPDSPNSIALKRGVLAISGKSSSDPQSAELPSSLRCQGF